MSLFLSNDDVMVTSLAAILFSKCHQSIDLVNIYFCEKFQVSISFQTRITEGPPPVLQGSKNPGINRVKQCPKRMIKFRLREHVL